MMTLTVQLSKTSDGLHDYLQVLSDDAVSINVVLVADVIVLRDERPREDRRGD